MSLIPQLQTLQEATDTSMLLHAKHASPDHEAVIIVSKDMDVLILALAFHQDIGNISMKCGTHTLT